MKKLKVFVNLLIIDWLPPWNTEPINISTTNARGRTTISLPDFLMRSTRLEVVWSIQTLENLSIPVERLRYLGTINSRELKISSREPNALLVAR